MKKKKLRAKKRRSPPTQTRPLRRPPNKMGVHKTFGEDGEEGEEELRCSEVMEEVPPLEEEEEEDVNICPTFTNEGEDDCDLPRRNLDAAFASTPTLPKKRRMPMLVDNNAAGGARQLPVARVGLGGATGAELSLERMQVRGVVTHQLFFPKRFLLKSIPSPTV
jgi:hypothetical protein